VRFVGLTSDGANKLEAIRTHLEEFGISWPNGYGAGDTLQALGVEAYPTTIVFGADGELAWRDEMGGSLESALEQALAAAGG
jgi:hypothetical protein